MFSNGKIIVIGGKKEEEARQVFDMYMAHFADLGHPIEYKDYHIQNIVACYKHTERINLDRLARKYSTVTIIVRLLSISSTLVVV